VQRLFLAAEGLQKRNNYQRLIWPLLKQMDAETVHDRTIAALALAQNNGAGRSLLRHIAGPLPQQPVELFGLTFPNFLGVAAGFDKEVQATDGLALLGFGHIEVGTITPRPQAGNEKPRVFRLVEDEAIINRMGFPSDGMEIAQYRLRALAANKRSYIIGASLGKQKETPLAQAAGDYINVMRAVFSYADYLAVNISSPNTPELRALQGEKYLGDLLGSLTAENRRIAAELDILPRPLLVKIAPDLSQSELMTILQVALEKEMDGIIATNTTITRNDLIDKNRDQAGGLSGKPLATRSLDVIATIARETAGRLPIIGVGGIRTADDVRSRLDAGASLVQIYTALVYDGPGLPGRLLRELATANTAVEV
jgi:dihydroorotate dehydrogenase